MAPSRTHDPIVLKKAQLLLTSSGCRDVDTPEAERRTARHTSPGINQPAGRHRQLISEPAARPHQDRADAPADTGEPCLPPECWIG